MLVGMFEERLTILSGLLYKRINATFSVVSLRGYSGNIVPAHGFDNVHHGLGLVGVWGHHPREEVVAGVITQLRSRGGIAHLRDLWQRKKERARDAVTHCEMYHLYTFV